MTKHSMTRSAQRATAKRYAEIYHTHGLRIVPVDRGSKNPNRKGWQNREWTPEDITENVGVILGAVSGELVDVDLDSVDALRLAPYFLPETLTFGRASKRASHWLYRSKGVRSDKLWFGEGEDRELVELRANNASGDGCGHQTVFPGSTHESGETIEFDTECEPTEIDPGELIWAVAKLATASTIAKGWTSGRHEKSLAITGGLLKAGWPAEDVRHLMAAVRESCGDSAEEEADFGHDVESTIDKAEAEGVDVLKGFGSLVQSGVLEEYEAKALERHSRSPATRKKEAALALTRMGRSLAAATLLEAIEVDANAITEAEQIMRAAWAKHEAADGKRPKPKTPRRPRVVLTLKGTDE